MTWRERFFIRCSTAPARLLSNSHHNADPRKTPSTREKLLTVVAPVVARPRPEKIAINDKIVTGFVNRISFKTKNVPILRLGREQIDYLENHRLWIWSYRSKFVSNIGHRLSFLAPRFLCNALRLASIDFCIYLPLFDNRQYTNHGSTLFPLSLHENSR